MSILLYYYLLFSKKTKHFLQYPFYSFQQAGIKGLCMMYKPMTAAASSSRNTFYKYKNVIFRLYLPVYLVLIQA